MPGDHESRLLLLGPSGGSAERVLGATVLVLGVGGLGGSGREYVAELHFVGLSKPVIGGEPGYIASVETAAVVREHSVAAAAALRWSLWAAASPAWFLWPMNTRMAMAARMPMMITDHIVANLQTRASYDSAPGWAKDPRAEADASVGTKRRSS